MLTEKQSKLLAYINNFHNNNGYTPRLLDMAEYMGVSVPAAWQHVRSLEKKGFINRSSFRIRPITITNQQN